MIKRLIAVGALALGLGLTTASMSAGDVPSDWPKTVKMGVIPTEGGGESKERFASLGDHLSKELGIKVEVVSASDYAGIITAMEHKHLDFAYLGPKSYTEAQEKAGAEAVGMELDVNGKPGYTPIIIAKKGSGINTFADAKGKTFCFTDPNSTSGCLVPSVVFSRDLKIDPTSYFSSVSFSGSHGASMLAVKNGKVDVAATNDMDMARMQEKGEIGKDEFTTIYMGSPLPGCPLAARKDLPQSLKDAFLKALLAANSDKPLLAKLCNGGYKACTDKDYDIIRYLKKVKEDKGKKK